MRSLVIVCLLCLPANALAQTPVVNPSTVTFAASLDHVVMMPDGSPLIASYEVQIFDGTTLAKSTDVGKPTPVSGDISVPLDRSGLTTGRTYTAHVAAKGPLGSARSATSSGPFVSVELQRPPTNVRVK